MFGNIVIPFGPTAQEMEAGHEQAQFNKQVVFKSHNVKIFDMHLASNRTAYEKLMMKMAAGIQAKTHHLWENERSLVVQRDGSHRWMRYIEWVEFDLKVSAIAPVGISKKR